MRLLAFSDLHVDIDQAERLAAASEDARGCGLAG